MDFMLEIAVITLVLLLYASGSVGWKAIPAQELSYVYKPAYGDVTTSLREADSFNRSELRRRDRLHSVYRFGYCTQEVLLPEHKRWVSYVNITSYKQSKENFIYFIRHHPVIERNIECILLKLYVEKKMMLRSQVPINFCKGKVFTNILMSTRRSALYEFYLPLGITLPADLVLELYYPTYSQYYGPLWKPPMRYSQDWYLIENFVKNHWYIYHYR